MGPQGPRRRETLLWFNKLFWQELVGSMMLKGIMLVLMGYVGFGLLLWLGEENSEWVIPCLALARIALEYALKPDPEKVEN